MAAMMCSICEREMYLKHRLRFNVYECRSCRLLTSDAGFDHSFTSYDTDARTVALKALRLGNFQKIITLLRQLRPGGQLRKGLEIGCGDGWWLETCKENDLPCAGIEPEASFKDYHAMQELDVTYGFYPEVNGGGAGAFDFIIFNDVFEHIPGINSLVASLKSDLNETGLIVINLPMSNGFFYRMATLLGKLGFPSYLERMWQFHFHSPHINYFNEDNLKALMRKHQLQCIGELRLDTINYKHLKERIKTDPQMKGLKAFLTTRIITLLKPVIAHSKPDIKVFFFERG